jgi:peptide/nickel transport system permease protein
MSGAARFLRKKQNLLAIALIGLFIFAAIAAPLLAPPDNPEKFSPYRNVKELKGRLPSPPGPLARWGTIATGIMGAQLDVFYTVVWGTRSALKFGLTVALLTGLFGVLVGATSAYLGGWTAAVLMRITDAFLAFPLIAGVVIISQLTMVGTGSSIWELRLPAGAVENSWSMQLLQQINPVMVAFILFLWMPYARLTYTMVLQQKGTEYIAASRSLGAGHMRVLSRHLIPNSISPAIILAARDIGLVVVLQATLTFIGIINDSEWGNLLSIGRRWIIGPGGNPLGYWWTFLPATLALILFGVGWNLLGDGLNDWLNPHSDH